MCVFKSSSFSVGFFFNILSCNGSAITNVACNFFWYLFIFKFGLASLSLHSLCHNLLSKFYIFLLSSISFLHVSFSFFFFCFNILGEEEMDVDVGMGDGGSVLPTASGN